ncbi:MAG: hypothetical protein M1333_03020 [Patescibacteria group bacterium]|nr:hypothetical protein [Patescibacteria group bacterium]
MKNHGQSGLKLKAEKREIKKRPRMQMHGRSLLKTSKYSGGKLVKKK